MRTPTTQSPPRIWTKTRCAYDSIVQSGRLAMQATTNTYRNLAVSLG
jgi:hypothetical protein